MQISPKENRRLFHDSDQGLQCLQLTSGSMLCDNT